MNVGHIRKMIEGMPDTAPVMSHLQSSCNPDDELNVVVETIQPSHGKDRLNIHISIVTDEQLQAREERPADAEPEVECWLTSDMFGDVDDIPMLDDDRHAFFCANGDDDAFSDSPWSCVLTEEEAEESGDVNITSRSWFTFSKSLTPDEQFAAIRRHLGLEGPPPVQPA